MKDYLETLVQGRSPVQGRNLVREYLQARILHAMQQAWAMSSLAFQGGTCAFCMRCHAIPKIWTSRWTMDWSKVALDVGQFLEDQGDLALVTKDNALRLLR